jgi:hypothetical protein
MTVVSHYTHRARDGSTSRYLRHLAFGARFRLLGGKWFLEVAPTYRFTTDGRKKYWFHEDRLSGIKRLEGNRSVLSQVLLWNDVLCLEAPVPGPKRLLGFGHMPAFEVDRPVSDDELISLDADDLAPDQPDGGTVVEEGAQP